MTPSFGLMAALACAVLGQTPELTAVNLAQDGARPVEAAPATQVAASLITDVTVYQGQALVTRDVSVPAGEGTVELVVTPLPAQTVDSSLFTEGADGLRVLSTRFRARAVQDDTRQEVRIKEEVIKKLEIDAKRLQKQIAVEQEDLGYIKSLGGFTGTALAGLTEKGRLDSEAILASSRFLMENQARRRRMRQSFACSCRPTQRRQSSPARSLPSCRPARAGSSAKR